jgi:hypothetical protein
MKQKLGNLKNREGFTFRWDKKGIRLINKRAKENKMNNSEYMRYCVEEEAKDE